MPAEPLLLSQHDPLHFVTEKASLLKALAHCQGVVERRNTTPILAHVHIEAQGKKIKITATDLEIACIESFAAQVHLSGRTTVSYAPAVGTPAVTAYYAPVTTYYAPAAYVAPADCCTPAP